MFDWCQNYNLPRMIMSIDFEKAFDSVSLELILITLDIFKFGKNFKLWIKIILGMEEGKKFNGVIFVNGNISTPFKYQEGADMSMQYRNIYLFQQFEF